MRGIYGGDGIIVATPPHGESSWKIHDTDLRGRRRWRGDGDVCGVLTMRDDISGVPVRRVPGNVTQPGKTQRALNIQTLEVQNRDSTGGTNATTVVQPLQGAHAGQYVVDAQTYRQV